MLNVCRKKKANYIFEELSNLYFLFLLISFFFFCELQQKIKPISESGEIIYLNFKVTRDLTPQTAPGYSSAQQQLQ